MSAFAPAYARAFLETAPAQYDIAGFLESAGSLSRAILENATLRAFLAAPTVPPPAKLAAVQQLAARVGLDAFGQRFFQVMLQNRRLLDAESILKSLREANDARHGILQGRVTVAMPIGEDEKKTIEDALAGRLGRRVRLDVEVDPTILAGFVAHVGSNIFDASASTEIRRFQEEARGKTGA
ncbi:MAG: ATP synthase F1 subunit delta [Acidobacteriota bacterium]